MPLNIVDHAGGNTIDIAPDVMARSTGTILLTGTGNVIMIATGCAFIDADIKLNRDNTVTMEADSRLARMEMFAIEDGHIALGRGIGCTWHTKLYLHEPGRISIGPEALIAGGVLVTVSDMHSVLDATTGERINRRAM